MTFAPRRATVVITALVAGALASGCSKTKMPFLVANIPPIVRLTAAPIDTNAVCLPDRVHSCYSLTFDWVGYDPDGRVDHYIYAVDPDSPDTSCHRASPSDTCWIVTTDHEKRLVFRAPSREPVVNPDGKPNPDSLLILRGYHVFVIAAVDNDGAIGPRAYRAFFSFTKAPTVEITKPRPQNANNVLLLPPSIRISWLGTDDDGVFTTKPVRYKYVLMTPGNEYTVLPPSDGFSGGLAGLRASQGAAVRRYCAPTFPVSQGWISVGGDTTTVHFADLVPGTECAFIVVAFDEAGAFSPVFAYDKNILQFTVGFTVVLGPIFTIYNEWFNYKYRGSTYTPSNEVRLEVPAGSPVTFNWFADPSPSADIRGYRWMLDGDVFDTHSRTDEFTDLKHWSTPGLGTTSATVGPFSGGEHFFYIDCEDETGLKTLATIHFSVIVPTFDKELLMVNDTRYRPEQYTADTLVAPQGSWPGAAELDTFMFAVGGVPWQKYPAGTLSSRGILHGYAFDTLGTRKGISDLSVPLATLGAYRHVIWLIDFDGTRDPSSALRFMTSPNRLNTLVAYLHMGGEAWLLGGGGAYETGIVWDYSKNNRPAGSYVWNVTNPGRELAPGRFMYDVPKWQSVVVNRSHLALVESEGNTIKRNLGRFRANPGVYLNVPLSFDKRNANTDPLPPKRLESQYYLTSWGCEFLDADNVITEPVLGGPNDLNVDGFNDTAAGTRWLSSDPNNTVVSSVPVASPGPTKAAGRALEIRTQGGGASDGDDVSRDLGRPRDWSGLASVRINIKQNDPWPAVQWRLRVIDNNGASASAPLIPSTTGSFADVTLSPQDLVADPGSIRPLNLLQIQKIQFVLANGDVPSETDFDNLETATLSDGAVLDTLLAAQLSFSPDTTQRPVNATMTVYHGHDFPKPFVFTGFAPWAFRRSQCQQLFDFVLQSLWGLTKNQTGFVASRAAMLAPAHQRPGTLIRSGAESTRDATGRVGLRKPARPRAGPRGTARP